MEAGKGKLTSELAWVNAFENWLGSKPSEHTRKAYSSAWRSLIEQSQVLPWELDRQNILDWLENMQAQGLARKTIQLRLGAVSSFYSSGLCALELPPAGGPNPAGGIPLTGTGTRRALSKEKLDAFLGAIPRDTINGRRDYALFLCYITTGRRTSEVRRMQYKNILAAGDRLHPHGGPLLEWGAGKKRRRESCPPQLWQALQAYLGDCLGEHRQEGYLFTAWKGGSSTGKPLAPDTVCKLVKKYARLAGLGSWVTVERLRRFDGEEKK